MVHGSQEFSKVHRIVGWKADCEILAVGVKVQPLARKLVSSRSLGLPTI